MNKMGVGQRRRTQRGGPHTPDVPGGSLGVGFDSGSGGKLQPKVKRG